ncbi:MAG: hypothetical protein ABSF82_08235 [Candidatus Bathyarchaeia archaeon]
MFRFEWLIVLFVLLLSATPLVLAQPKVDVNFTVARHAGTVYVTAWAQGELPPAVLFNVSIWYNARGTHGFVSIFSGTLVQSADGYASTLVQATIPNGGTQKNGHYFVRVELYDPATGSLLGFAGYDPRAGGSNGGVGC